MSSSPSRSRRFLGHALGAAALAALSISACRPAPADSAPAQPLAPAPAPSGPAPAEEARAFAQRTDADLKRLWVAAGQAEWEKQTNITDANEVAAAKANAEVMAYVGKAIGDAHKHQNPGNDPDTARMLELLRVSTDLPGPADAQKRDELAQVAAKLDGMYGKGKVCTKPDECRDLGQLSDVLAKGKSWNEMLEAWKGWRTVSVEMKPLYQRLVELGNEGAREIGFADVGELWRSQFDMAPDAFAGEVERLWSQVQPLYEQLHCHVRARLHKRFGKKVADKGPIPAHVLGNMWAQDWSNLYPTMVPYPKEPSLDVTKALVKRGYDPVKMVKTAEAFFDSLGLGKLPETFWQRSMFDKPKDRDVVCHASAWDVTMDNDLRIKMCIKVNQEDLITIHHELGHDYYFKAYHKLPALYQGSAHSGFHEAIGDAIALSATPRYLKEIGILDAYAENERAELNGQLQMALSKLAFLPFGKLVDQWRWEVFAGKIGPGEYNAGWWRLVERYQGIAAPEPRGEEFFDAGSKYHVPANVPYVRYFLSHILQFQLHKAMCEAAGHAGPLHRCSIYGSKAAGARLQAMLELGRSKPWPDALEALAGTRQMDAGALVEYFAPLLAWLQDQNKGRTCGFAG